jgi:hypothetical protein
LTRTPILAFNIAQARRLAHRCDEALAYYRLFRDSPGVELPSDFEELWKRTEACAQEQAAARERLQEKTAAPAASPASSSRAKHTPHPMPAHEERPRQEQEPAGSPWRRWVGVSALAAASASGVAATVMTIRAARAAARTSGLSEQPGSVWDPAAQANESSGRTAATWAEILFPATAALAGTGIWLVISSGNSKSESAAVELHAGPGDLSARVRYRF